MTPSLDPRLAVFPRDGLDLQRPLRLRWNFHRLMLGQSMAFYADEFAGRITTKIMQTALAVRDMIFTTTDVQRRARILVTRAGTMVEIGGRGETDYLLSPVDPAATAEAVEQAIRARR